MTEYFHGEYDTNEPGVATEATGNGDLKPPETFRTPRRLNVRLPVRPRMGLSLCVSGGIA
jgi:hypothetical protein